MSTPEREYWLFWDGDCGFCRRVVAWVTRRDVARRIRAVPYQDDPRPPMTEDLARRCAGAVHVLTPQGTLLSAGRASLCVLRLLGYTRMVRTLSCRPLVWGVELGYWLVAGNRRFFSWLLFQHPSL